MPNARVGALPQTISRELTYQDHHDKGRGGRQLGMTMEDLKKQTAIRLAEEQHQVPLANRQHQRSRNARNQHHLPQAQQNVQHIPSNPQTHSQPTGYSGRSNRFIVQNYDQNNKSDASTRNQMQKSICENSSGSHNHHNNSYFRQTQTQLSRTTHHPYNFVEPHARHNTYSDQYIDPTRQHLVEKYSETSSIYSDVDRIPSNADFGEAPIVSGTNSTLQHQHANANPNSSLQAAVGKMKKLSKSNLNQRNAHNNFDGASVVSTSSSKSSRGGSSSNSVTIPASIYSRTNQHNHHFKHKQQLDFQSAMFRQPQQRQENHQQLNFQQQLQNYENSSSFSHETQNTMKVNPPNRHAINNHNKLPHGLTVHELKEMTRARLAAEAAVENTAQTVSERNARDHHRLYPNQDTQLHSSQDHGIQPGARNKDKSPSAVQGQKEYQEYFVPKSMQYHSHRSNQRKTHPRNHHHNHHFNNHSLTENTNLMSVGNGNNKNRTHMDSADSASIASFNSTIGSEYMGSETASSSFLGSTIQQQPPNDDAMLFVRSWSYPSANNLNNTVNDGMSPPVSCFDSSDKTGNVVGSRRRLGSSPPGFYLEVPHEDEPLAMSQELPLGCSTGGADNHGIRNFDDLSQKSVDSSISRSEKLQGLSPHFHNHDNSARYSNPVSPHHMKLSGSEITLNCKLGSEMLRKNVTRAFSSNEDLPNWVAESVLETPMLNNNRKAIGRRNSDQKDFNEREGSGIEGVFRAQDNSLVSSKAYSLNSVASHGYLNSDVPILGQGADASGSWGGSNSVRSAPNISEFLNQDFSNLLSLNSSRENNDSHPRDQFHDSAFKSRIDPEVIDSPCSVDDMGGNTLGSHFSKSVRNLETRPASRNHPKAVSERSTSTRQFTSSKSQRRISANKKRREKNNRKKENDAQSVE